MNNENTSQDPDYYGPTGFEKKFHQDHFAGMGLIGTQEWYIWSDGTRHRFKEKTNRNRKTGAGRGGKQRGDTLENSCSGMA